MGNILIVDDDAAVRDCLCEAVETLGHHACAAQNGRDALELFDAQPFDCVITDLAMPEVDGLTVLRRVKRRRPGTGVLIITGNSTVELLAASVNGGADAYVTKPFRIAELDTQLSRILGAPRDLAPAAEPAGATEARRPRARSRRLLWLGLSAALLAVAAYWIA